MNLGALDAEDLKVISSLAQDAVFPASEMRWHQKGARFALLLNRVRWEDSGETRHAAERVQSVLMFNDVLRVSSQGVDQGRRRHDPVAAADRIQGNRRSIGGCPSDPRR